MFLVPPPQRNGFVCCAVVYQVQSACVPGNKVLYNNKNFFANNQ